MLRRFGLGGIRRNKFGAKPTAIDGIRFASRREALRYQQLRLRERAGEIRDLERQVPYDLTAVNLQTGELTVVSRYLADFRYTRIADGAQVVEDAKGFRTDVYRLKKKFVEAAYGIAIVEI